MLLNYNEYYALVLSVAAANLATSFSITSMIRPVEELEKVLEESSRELEPLIDNEANNDN